MPDGVAEDVDSEVGVVALEEVRWLEQLRPELRGGGVVARRLVLGLPPTHSYRFAFRSLLVTTVRFQCDRFGRSRVPTYEATVYVGSPEHAPSSPLCPDTSLNHSQTPNVESSIDSMVGRCVPGLDPLAGLRRQLEPGRNLAGTLSLLARTYVAVEEGVCHA